MILLICEVDEAEEMTPDVDRLIVDVECTLGAHLFGHCGRSVVIDNIIILPECFVKFMSAQYQ